ncbi:hypothetical protein ABC766_33390 (plasmid) [Methylobacterium fujisawaense]|jgi:hypothetical protein|uniref:hypothetical protein n=1 Tax=Methylobacterium fujisawaense TaxID=107400 RepID=UPI0031F5AB5C
MRTLSRRGLLTGASGLAALMLRPKLGWALEKRNDVDFLRGPYNEAFFFRHNFAYRIGAGMHFFHSKQHDLLQLTPFEEHAEVDARFDKEATGYVIDPPLTEPTMEYYSSYISRAMYTLFRTIDWTHMHHEQTYDIMSDKGISWVDKKIWTDRAVRYYLDAQQAGIPRSVAPLELTMRRVGIMMKPYFNYFRNFYPRDQALFYVAHWWHPAVYEAFMISGNRDQEIAVKGVEDVMYREILPNRPGRMVLSREIMPRYARMSPESANIFDNLHMLHGIAYSILAYKGWSIEEKRDEMYRVIEAMGYQPGDEAYATKFHEPYPTYDPRTYPAWVRSPEGAMGKIMMEMLMEMLPMMYPQGLSKMQKAAIMQQMMKSGRLGIEPGELPGSLRDAIMQVAPGMTMMPGATAPGETPQMMTDMMVANWKRKAERMPSIPPIDMRVEPTLVAPPVPRPEPSAPPPSLPAAVSLLTP